MGDLHRAALDTIVYVAPHSLVTGVWSPGRATSACRARGCTEHSSDWREPPGSAENRHGAEASLTRESIATMLSTHYDTEAHFSAYAMFYGGRSVAKQPRVAKDGVAWIREQGYELVLTSFLADWDTPGHVPWTPESRAAFDTLWRSRRGPLATCGMYLSPKGARLVQPLAQWLPVEQGEAALRAWLQSLVDIGVDPTVTVVHDWTRMMRTPHHRRKKDNLLVAPAAVDLSRMVPIEPPPAPSVRFLRPKRVGARPTNEAPPKDFDTLVPHGWETTAVAIGAAIRDSVKDGAYRRCYMALSGALVARGCPIEGIPAIVVRAHSVDRTYPEWDALIPDREELARSTVTKAAQGVAVLGYGALRAEFPAVAEALDAMTVSNAEAGVLRQLAVPTLKPVPVADAVAGIRLVLKNAYGVTLIAAPPGTGKTHAVTEHARHLPVIGQRAAPGARIVVSAPTHELARQTAAKLAPKSLHLFSPPSHIDKKTGDPTCIYVDAARALAKGGQSVAREFCEGRGKSPCEVAGTCPARAGFEGDLRANLITGVHGLIRELLNYAGTAGTLVIDEPGEVLVSERITLEQFDLAKRTLDEFERKYEHAMAPALEAFTAWATKLGDPEAEHLTSLPDVIRAGASKCSYKTLSRALIDPETPDELLGDEVIGAVAEAIAREKGNQPPVKWSTMLRARPNPARAEELGQASRVLLLLRRGLLASTVHAARVDERGGERAVTLTGPNEDLLIALKHEGPVVVIAADAEIHAPAIEKVLGFAPKVVKFNVLDSARIARSILVSEGATRSGWLPRGVPDWEAILPTLKYALAWAAKDPATKRIGLILPKEMHAAVAHVLRPTEPATLKLVKASRLTKKALDAVRLKLAPALATFPGEIMTGHYGALRGLDFMADCDATITLGDPRPNLGDEIDRAAYLGLDVMGRLDAMAAAELQQAHGRLRTIHRQKPGRQLHVGTVVPEGWQGLAVEILRLGVGRRRVEGGTMSGAELAVLREGAAMSVRECATALGITHTTLRRYEAGERVIPPEVVRAALLLAQSGTETAEP